MNKGNKDSVGAKIAHTDTNDKEVVVRKSRAVQIIDQENR